MKTHLGKVAVAMTFLLAASVASAINTTVKNITIGDPNVANVNGGVQWEGNSNTWYKGDAGAPGTTYNNGSTTYTVPTTLTRTTGIASEYQEVEPGMITGAVWDLAAFTQGNGTLGVLSGYNLKDGYSGTTIGDIFIETNPQAGANTLYRDPNDVVQTSFVKNGSLPGFNFDYALRFNFDAATYSIIKLDANTLLQNGEYAGAGNYNAASNPWRVANSTNGDNSANIGELIARNPLSYTSAFNANTLTGLDLGTVGPGYKYYAELQDMGWLNDVIGLGEGPAAFHLTMWCGNDDLYGIQSGSFIRTPDGGATVSLLGISLLAILGASTLKRRTAAR